LDKNLVKEATLKQAYLQFAQTNPQTKNCKRACFANADKNCFKKISQRFKKNKNTPTN
jgi:NADPH-dependent glutamate synthase beta subunit-like oxidoreductase